MSYRNKSTIADEVYLRLRAAPSRCVAILAVLFAAPAASSAELDAPGGARQLDPEQPVWVDVAASKVYVGGRVTLREGVLEMFACPTGTKEHESIVAIDAKAMLIHTALLAVGAEPGSPVQFQPEYRPPTGTEIDVRIEWMANGAKQSTKAQDWVRNADTGEPMKLPFVFAGSGFWTDPDTKQTHYLAEGGDLICVSNFGAAMLDVPAPSTQANDELWFEPFTERIPPEGTPVRLVLTPVSAGNAEASSVSLDDAIETIRGVRVGVGSTEAIQSAWRVLSAAPVAELPKLLDAMQGASPLAENWLRSAIDAVADRVDQSVAIDASMMQYVRDESKAPRARRTAYEVLRRYRPNLAEALLDVAIDDPSPEMRYEAVAKLINKLEEGSDKAKIAGYRFALKSARSLDQIETVEKQLEELGEPVDLAKQLGFVTAWRVAGPFDNRSGVGFDEAYAPEAGVDLDAEYTGHDEEGPQGPFGWKVFTTDDRLGEVELNDAIGSHKGAVGYAWAEIESEAGQPIEVRLQSVCATKVWVNGELVATNPVYHSGSTFDQYVAEAKLNAGMNVVLLKVCQNEQTQPWAQTWPFALRITGPAGEPLEGVTQPLAEGEE